jgi:hypothetical protein
MNIIKYDNPHRHETLPRAVRLKGPYEQPRTIILDGLPSYDEVSKAMASWILTDHNLAFMIRIGVAKLHPKDDFCRKEGLEVAKKNLKDEYLQVYHLKVDNDRNLFVRLEGLNYVLSVKYKKSGGCYLNSFIDKEETECKA